MGKRLHKIDKTNRLIIPMKIRKLLQLDSETPVEMFLSMNDDALYLRKYNVGCAICGSVEDIVFFRQLRICRCCIDEIKSAMIREYGIPNKE